MNRYLLLILLSSWSLLVTNSLQCDTGVAIPGHLLSVQRSSLANADVAFLQLFNATSVESCMEDCCAGKFGDCTVASYEKSTNNCRHFSCRPLNKCKFLSSASMDSFTFSSTSHIPHSVPSSSVKSSTTTTTTAEPRTAEQTTTAKQKDLAVTKEQTSAFTTEKFALKNDNTTIKPRKGVDDLMPGLLPLNNFTRSGIKPRKGVTMEDVPHSKYLLNNTTRSKVKPRKGVGPYTTSTSAVAFTEALPTTHSTSTIKDSSVASSTSHPINHFTDIMSNDLISALEKVFEDEPSVQITKLSISPTSVYTEEGKITPTHSHISTEITSSTVLHTSSSSKLDISSSSLWPSYSTHYYFPESSSKDTPELGTSSSRTSELADYTMMPLMPSHTISAIMAQSTQESRSKVSLGNLRLTEMEEESENERKYKSSMHLVLSLVFGLLVLFAVLGVVAKRVYDGWLRRHYRRMDFLIDGMYNGYG